MLYNEVTGKWVGRAKSIRYMKELDRIAKANGNVLTTGMVLEAARAPDSPLHSWFEWSDRRAAERWRRLQASRLIGSYKMSFTVVNEKQTKVAQRYKGVITEDKAIRAFLPMRVVSESYEGRALLMSEWITALRSLAEKHPVLTELKSARQQLRELADYLESRHLKRTAPKPRAAAAR